MNTFTCGTKRLRNAQMPQPDEGCGLFILRYSSLSVMQLPCSLRFHRRESQLSIMASKTAIVCSNGNDGVPCTGSHGCKIGGRPLGNTPFSNGLIAKVVGNFGIANVESDPLRRNRATPTCLPNTENQIRLERVSGIQSRLRTCTENCGNL
jgi:hypothetical protein